MFGTESCLATPQVLYENITRSYEGRLVHHDKVRYLLKPIHFRFIAIVGTFSWFTHVLSLSRNETMDVFNEYITIFFHFQCQPLESCLGSLGKGRKSTYDQILRDRSVIFAWRSRKSLSSPTEFSSFIQLLCLLSFMFLSIQDSSEKFFHLSEDQAQSNSVVLKLPFDVPIVPYTNEGITYYRLLRNMLYYMCTHSKLNSWPILANSNTKT